MCWIGLLLKNIDSPPRFPYIHVRNTLFDLGNGHGTCFSQCNVSFMTQAEASNVLVQEACPLASAPGPWEEHALNGTLGPES